MKRLFLSNMVLILSAATLVACGGETSMPNTPTPNDRITVQHILIGFKEAVGFGGNAPPKAAPRTQEQAKTLAYDVLARVKAGEDYDKLIAEFTDDSAPGIYNLVNNGVTPQSSNEYPRSGMVAAFGDIGFALKVGEIGIADYDPQKSPFGYHIIKRVK